MGSEELESILDIYELVKEQTLLTKNKKMQIMSINFKLCSLGSYFLKITFSHVKSDYLNPFQVGKHNFEAYYRIGPY